MTTTRHDRQPIGGSRPAARRRAFTLVEVMVVIMILAILLALVVGVGKTVMREVGRTKTKQIQDIVVAAINAYYDAQGTYPLEFSVAVPGRPLIVDPNFYGTGIGPTDGMHSGNLAARLRNAYLYSQLMGEPASAKKMQSLPPEAAYTTTKIVWGLPASANKFVRDGYDNDMDYRVSMGLGARPVLISPGPDGWLGQNDYLPSNSLYRDYDVDNIRSDGYGR